MNKAKDYIQLHLNILLFSLTSVFSKAASVQLNRGGIKNPLLYVFLFLMVANCGIYAIAWQKVIKKFSLSTAYANRSVYLIWSQIWAVIIFHENLTVKNIIGLLIDQGYWPDGLYTAPSEEAWIFDILEMKKIGFNMVRKHIKIEPQRWYYHCDRLGVIVWQDMVNGGEKYQSWFVTYLATVLSGLGITVKDHYSRLFARRSQKGRIEFINEVKETIELLLILSYHTDHSH